MDGAEAVGKLQPRGNEISKFDNLFGMKLRYFEGSVTFVQKIKFTKPDYHIDVYVEYGACNDQNCMPPSEATFKGSGKSPAVDSKAAKEEKAQKEAQLDPAALAKAKADSPAKLNANAVDSTRLWILLLFPLPFRLWTLRNSETGSERTSGFWR